ncbi:IQ domain-containing protein K [Carlito syrichta]|uniref:IQ domain-containing protein K n=1 Tax=Carlito syrichta TaxID=1868482 RepID=A0A3Q0E5F5_CARSF|nr:IQ domain-containing protein K [Carlito syrichta]
MAVPGLDSGRTVQREELSCSANSSVTPVLAVSPGSPEMPLSPGQVTEPPSKSLWEQICEEYEAEQPPFPEGYQVKQEAVITVSPLGEMLSQGFNTEHCFPVSHFTMISQTPCPQDKPETVDPKTCSPKEYLETFIFPVLLPGMASLLHQAKKEKCFERKRTKFIACDFLTEWLYNQNPKRTGEPFTEFFSIPFVEEWLKHHPRPPIPLSLLLTEEEAVVYIQSFWRAYMTRRDPEIQELRQWQKKLREGKHIRQRVKIFWAKQEQKGLFSISPELQLEGFPWAVNGVFSPTLTGTGEDEGNPEEKKMSPVSLVCKALLVTLPLIEAEGLVHLSPGFSTLPDLPELAGPQPAERDKDGAGAPRHLSVGVGSQPR